MFNGLICQNVTKLFSGSESGVRDVTLTVPWGSLYVLLGANGAGKTTLLNLCLNHLLPDSGSITIAGADVNDQPRTAKQRLAYVPEVARLYGHLNALENIRFFGKLSGRRHGDDEIVSALERLRFHTSALRVPTANFSKGMRQKVVIAVGLLKGADVFLLDEPTSGLDPRSVRAVVELLQELKGDGKALFATSHDLQNVTAAADRVGVLSGGRLILDAAASEFDATRIDESFHEQ